MTIPAASTSLAQRARVAGLIGGPLLGIGLYLALPTEYAGATEDAGAGQLVPFTHAGRATLALTVWMAVWWLTEAIDVSATALLPLVMLPILGAASLKQAAAPYGSDLIFLFMGGFLLAISMQRWGLDRRIALHVLRLAGTKPVNLIGGVMVATALLSAFVSNTATAAMMLPIGLSITTLVIEQTREQGDGPDSTRSRNFAICIMLGIAYAASIGGVATIIGTPPNTFVVGYLRDQIDPAYRHNITFARWLLIGVPLVIILLPATWLMLTRIIFPVRMPPLKGGRELIARSYRELGPMKVGEWATLIVFLLAAVSWMFGSIISKGLLGDPAADGSVTFIIPPLVPELTDAGIAITAGLLLFLIPVRRRPLQMAMDWPAASQLPWGILILFGGGLSIAFAIETNGVAEFIGHQSHHVGGVHPLMLILIVTASVTFFSEIASNTATITTLAPILAAMAPGLGVHPMLLVIPAALAASCAFMMPVGTPPNAIVFGTGYVTVHQMMKAGWWLNCMAIALITGLTWLVIRPLFGLG